MLKIRSYDEISGEWVTQELELVPSDCTDPVVINKAIDTGLCGDDCDGWEVTGSYGLGECKTQPSLPSVLTILVRDDRHRQGIILVNYEEQDSEGGAA